MTEKRSDFVEPGDVLAGKYEVEHVLGVGGMGAVVAARHTTLGQRVAIKFLLPAALEASGARERFLREARASIGIKSQHIARTQDIGTLDSGAPYIVMELLEGSDLREVLKSRGPLEVEVAADWVIQACEALAEAHQLGVVHRDLKPANLFVTSHADGSPLVKVLDFGISKAPQRDSAADLTRTDAMLGSPAYMSPEQVRNAKQVDARTDLWALGAVLYEAVSGLPPFDAETVVGLGAKICMDEPKPLSELRPGVPQAFSDIVHRCLEKNPDRRFSSVTELATALGPFAPASSRALVDRIARMGSSAGIAFDATVEALPTAALTKSAPMQTDGGWGRTRQASGSRSKLVTLALLAGGGVLLLVLGWRAVAGRAPSSEPAPAVQATPRAPLPEPPPAPLPAPLERAVAPALPSARPTASVRATKPAPALKPAPPKCPAGTQWQNGRCERPLATEL